MSDELRFHVGMRDDVLVFERTNSVNLLGIGVSKDIVSHYIDEENTEKYHFVILNYKEAKELVEAINKVIERVE